MPMSKKFENRLIPVLNDIVDHFGTPFHIYDEVGIRETGKTLYDAFSKIKNFKEFFAVKALPNLRILEIMKNLGFGFDCSSIAELELSRMAKGKKNDIIFTSNNTSIEDFRTAESGDGCILNLDDISLLPKVPNIPELISFRYNPGERRIGNSIIGNPLEAKYGVSHNQLIDAYKNAKEMGVRKFGIHSMLASNELNYKYMIETTKMLIDITEWISHELNICFDFINIGGGLGIPYKPDQQPLDLELMGIEITSLFEDYKTRNNIMPAFYLESGRYLTGRHGVLVTKAINQKNIYRRYIGVDACMSALMRPGIYGAYHQITVPFKEHLPNKTVVDVVGSLCENNDKFAIERELPDIEDGDLLIIHDTGAHGHAMGFNYNGKLRPKELLLRVDGNIELIRREETIEDYFTTLNFDKNILKISK